jgi:Ser/Thr protein kinase RdoA (MazF antagonist)
MLFSHVESYLDSISDIDRRSKAEIVFRYFEKHVVPKIPSFEKGIIHNDFNGWNIIMDKQHTTSDAYEVAGIIDFGDSVGSCTVFDLGICLAYLMMENLHCSSVVTFVGPLIQGYHSVLPLNLDEFDSLYYLVLARCVTSGVMGADAFKAEPWNTYLLISLEKAWTLLDLLLNTRKDAVDAIWKNFL